MNKLVCCFFLALLCFSCAKEKAPLLYDTSLVTATFDTFNPCAEQIAIDGLLLPSAIQEMLQANYPTATVQSIKEQLDNGTILYDVRLNNQKEILLQNNGTVVVEAIAEVDKMIPLTEVPISVRSYISANFPASLLLSAQQMKEYNKEYLYVQLENNGHLLFDASNNFLCASGDFVTYGGYDEDDDEGGTYKDDDDG